MIQKMALAHHLAHIQNVTLKQLSAADCMEMLLTESKIQTKKEENISKVNLLQYIKIKPQIYEACTKDKDTLI